jgi:hypothetical protein
VVMLVACFVAEESRKMEDVNFLFILDMFVLIFIISG